MVEVQTTQQRDMRDAIDAHDRRMAELQVTVRDQLPEARREVQGPQGADPIRATRPRGARLADRWREGMKHAAAELDAVNREVDGYCPTWNDPPGPTARCPGSSRP